MILNNSCKHDVFDIHHDSNNYITVICSHNSKRKIDNLFHKIHGIDDTHGGEFIFVRKVNYRKSYTVNTY